MTWQDAEDVALALMEAHPDTDPLTVRFTDLHKRVVALPAGVWGAAGCRPAFQDDPAGAAPCSTWKGTPSFLSAARNLAMSSPSTRSSVSSSRRWTAGPVSTMSRGVSPATTPSAMRMASFARWETRGSSEIRTRTGCRAATLVEREEAVGGVDDVGEH